MFTSNEVPVTVRGKEYQLIWTLDSAIAAEKLFGLARSTWKKATDAYREREGNMALLKALAFCMLQSSDEPPTMKELGRMTVGEIEGFRSAVQKAIGLGEQGPVGKEAAAAAKSDAEGGDAGTGESNSSRPSTVAA